MCVCCVCVCVCVCVFACHQVPICATLTTKQLFFSEGGDELFFNMAQSSVWCEMGNTKPFRSTSLMLFHMSVCVCVCVSV
ncbi:MAG: hypothetical protein ACRC4N_07195 [Gammaproteobacteria bacterium]